jgi:hypothetical protein
MLSKKTAMLILKLSLCVATAIVIWANPSFASAGPGLCPPDCQRINHFCFCP